MPEDSNWSISCLFAFFSCLMSASSFLFDSIFPAFDLIFVNSTCNSPTLRRSEFNFFSSSSCEIDFLDSFVKDPIFFLILG